MDYMDPMSSVLKKADKLNLSLSLYMNWDSCLKAFSIEDYEPLTYIRVVTGQYRAGME